MIYGKESWDVDVTIINNILAGRQFKFKKKPFCA